MRLSIRLFAWIAVLAALVRPQLCSAADHSAYYWRTRADACVLNGDYAAAVDAFRRAAALYGAQGDSGAEKVLDDDAARYETRIGLYLHEPTDRSAVRSLYTGRRLEPRYGAYLGAFIDREDRLTHSYMDENGQTHMDTREFNRAVGKDHAIFFMYMSYGRRFPRRWTDHLKRNDAAAQLVLSPATLDEVRDDAYLHRLAEEAARSRIPIFLRFAGEMNGDWVPYHADPRAYIEKFRLVARVFHETAPNVAMVWCVNDIPEEKIDRYYPGEDAVDWVGVNFYSVPFHNGDLTQPALWRDPSDSLRYVYGKYAARHPIMIGEWAASHLCRADERRRPEFANEKMRRLYASLPRLYPRVKAVNWLSMDTIRYARAERQLNDFSLLDDSNVAACYRDAIASPYYLSRVSLDEPEIARERIRPLTDAERVRGVIRLSDLVKSPYPNLTGALYVNGKPESVTGGGDAPSWTVDLTRLPHGSLTITLVLRDERGRERHRLTRRIVNVG